METLFTCELRNWVLFASLNNVLRTQSSLPYTTGIDPPQLSLGLLQIPKVVHGFSLVCSVWVGLGQDSKTSCSRAGIRLSVLKLIWGLLSYK